MRCKTAYSCTAWCETPPDTSLVKAAAQALRQDQFRKWPHVPGPSPASPGRAVWSRKGFSTKWYSDMGQRTEDRGQRSEIRDQGSEIRSQGLELHQPGSHGVMFDERGLRGNRPGGSRVWRRLTEDQLRHLDLSTGHSCPARPGSRPMICLLLLVWRENLVQALSESLFIIL